MTRKEIKDKIKEHRKEILIVAGTTITAGVLGYLGIKWNAAHNAKGMKIIEALSNSSSGRYPWADGNTSLKLDTATVSEVWREGEWTNFILNDFKPADIGKLGAELIEKVPEINEDMVLTCVLSTTN